MKKTFLIITILFTAICSMAERVHKEGAYELQMGEFSKIDVVNGINVVHHCSEDSAGMVTFQTTDAVASKILFEVRKDKLIIQKAFHDANEMVADLPTIHVYSRFITGVKNSGDSTVTVINPKSTMNFKAEVVGNGRIIVRDVDCSKFDGSVNTGNGTLVVNGTCIEAVLTNTGVGTIQADNLKAERASCRFFGKGTTGIWVTEELQVKGLFPGKLYYRGEPKKIKNFGAGVKIIPMTAE